MGITPDEGVHFDHLAEGEPWLVLVKHTAKGEVGAAGKGGAKDVGGEGERAELEGSFKQFLPKIP